MIIGRRFRLHAHLDSLKLHSRIEPSQQWMENGHMCAHTNTIPCVEQASAYQHRLRAAVNVMKAGLQCIWVRIKSYLQTCRNPLCWFIVSLHLQTMSVLPSVLSPPPPLNVCLLTKLCDVNLIRVYHPAQSIAFGEVSIG